MSSGDWCWLLCVMSFYHSGTIQYPRTTQPSMLWITDLLDEHAACLTSRRSLHTITDLQFKLSFLLTSTTVFPFRSFTWRTRSFRAIWKGAATNCLEKGRRSHGTLDTPTEGMVFVVLTMMTCLRVQSHFHRQKQGHLTMILFICSYGQWSTPRSLSFLDIYSFVHSK